MKGMILAAGLGTRLRPYTHHTPKPLFPVGGRPILDHAIDLLVDAGCRRVMVNTHHLPDRMDTHLRSREYPVPVTAVHEPEILGTGGALANIRQFWEHEPLLVVNADVVIRMDIHRLIAHHRRHAADATLVLVDNAEFNSVRVDDAGRIVDFGTSGRASGAGDRPPLTFTGIQIIEPSFLDHLPPGPVFSSIEVYRRMIEAGLAVHAYLPEDVDWIDTGTPKHYRQAVLNTLLPDAFHAAFGHTVRADDVRVEPLPGDGSQRRWYRLRHGERRLVMVDHGIRDRADGTTEADAFVDIGQHLLDRGVPVPPIAAASRFAGIALMEDAGDTNLQEWFQDADDANVRRRKYQQVIDAWLHMAVQGADGFDNRWTWQTPRYDRNLILEKECRYFVEAFLNGVCGLEIPVAHFQSDFERLADAALADSVDGFMHRDFQSRNIMVCGDQIRIIDYQGGRRGPIQYDLASLLVDPYVSLPPSEQEDLLQYASDNADTAHGIDPDRLVNGFRWLSVCRLLQALGAYGHLSRNLGKAQFAAYIPAAVRQLRLRLGQLPSALPTLNDVIDDIALNNEPGP